MPTTFSHLRHECGKVEAKLREERCAGLPATDRYRKNQPALRAVRVVRVGSVTTCAARSAARAGRRPPPGELAGAPSRTRP